MSPRAEVGLTKRRTDVKLSELRRFYDAVIFSTGARADRELDIPDAILAHLTGRGGRPETE